MERQITYHIPPWADGMKIEGYLRRKGYSRQNLIELKKPGESILVNGLAKHFNERLCAGDTLCVLIRENERSKVLPVELPISIVYEDEDLLVVNKPAGMPTHPSIRNYDNSLANALAWYFQQKGEAFLFRCSNRLDRDTSGLTIVSKHFVSASILSQMGSRRELHREYLAIVSGEVTPPEGTIDQPLGRKPGSIIERCIDPNGERAVTHYRLLKVKDGHSLVSLTLETGRTHQIRIHMKYLGFPLIGDYLYNPDYTHISRQALHAYRLRFMHPITGKVMEFTAPLPEDMRFIFSCTL